MVKPELVLEELGLSSAESKIYLALQKLGPSRAGQIMKAVGFQNSVVHLTLGRLIGKGFVSYIRKGHVRIYEAVHPDAIVRILDDRKARFEAAVPALLSMRRASEQLSAEIFEGLAGFKSMLYELIEDGQAGDDFLFFAFYHTDPKVQEEIYPLYVQFEKERENRGLRLKGIVPAQVRSHFKLRTQVNLRYSTRPVLDNINIFRDKVTLTPWGDRKVSFLIRSPQLAEQFTNYFNLMWESLETT